MHGNLLEKQQNHRELFYLIYGELAEWFMAAVLKTDEPEMVPGVQIPHSPPNLGKGSGMANYKDYSGVDVASIYEAAADILRESGYEAEVREDYSGRGMYGRTCCGIITNASGPMVGYSITCAMSDLGIDPFDWVDLIPKRWDSMGLQSIYY